MSFTFNIGDTSQLLVVYLFLSDHQIVVVPLLSDELVEFLDIVNFESATGVRHALQWRFPLRLRSLTYGAQLNPDLSAVQ